MVKFKGHEYMKVSVAEQLIFPKAFPNSVSSVLYCIV